MHGVSRSDFDGVVSYLSFEYEGRQFAELDQSLTCLLRPDVRFPSGRPGAAAVYWMFRRQFMAPGMSEYALFSVKDWKKALPDSPYAELAQIRWHYAQGWNGRGMHVASDVPAGGWKIFGENLALAEKLALEASPALENTPLWHNMLMAITLDSPDPKTDPDHVFAEGVAKWPEYYDFYEARLTRLGPLWGGSWQGVDAFIEEWSKRRKATEGDSLYARLYGSVIRDGADFRDTLIKWPRMKTSLVDLMQRYPDPTNKELAVSLACLYEDRDFAKTSFGRIDKTELEDGSGWLKGIDIGKCLAK